ncbi:hypothetical protein NMG60_11035411 [Bertholletia excelsa]
MAKGGGLSFDSDRIGLFLHQPTVINSFAEDNHHHLRHLRHLHPPPKLKAEPMDASADRSPVPTIQFPVNLNCTADKRPVIGEMDFFADKKHDKEPKPSDDDIKDLPPTPELDINLNTGLRLLTANTSSDQSMVDDGVQSNSEDKRAKTELAILQAEMERMNAENQRLREMLNQVTTNYNALQKHLMTLMQHNPHDRKLDDDEEQEQINQTSDGKVGDNTKRHGSGGPVVPRQFIDLGLAGTAGDGDEHSPSSSEERPRSPPNNGEAASKELYDHGREDSPNNGSGQGWVPNKVPKLNPSPKNVDQAAEATMRKARVSVRARSEASMISDGCQWRKYGQKMAKGNPCPRAYYRCTMAAGCPVRKQVQRCAEDRSILITTYEGNHNHPLPPAAMAMASTTSSAARMLLSGSMPSADGLMNPNFLARTLLPCSSSMATISASAPFPTVTLDLTQSPNPLQHQRPPAQFQLPFPNPPPNFAATGTPASLLPQIFGQALYNQSKFSGLQMSQEAEATQLGHQAPSLPQPSLADTVNALTTDPNFTAALAAAITSLIGGGNNNAVSSSNNCGGASAGNHSNSSDKQ